MKESKLTREKILTIIRKQPHAWAFKVAAGPFQERGLPDIIGCINGRFFAIEGKVGRNTTTPSQEIVQGKIIAANGKYAVMRESITESELVDWLRKV